MKRMQLNELVFVAYFIVLFTIAQPGDLPAQNVSELLESTANNLHFRNIGPAIMGGRIDDIAVVESDPYTIYVGTAAGGLWKTVNNGVTWRPIFDDQKTSSIGAVSIAPSNPEILWVGTGEANNRQSSSWGSGVMKSYDGGTTWKHAGLEDTHHIGGIAIDHTDPDVVFIAAAGHLWGPNEDRGLYRTLNGGDTWDKVLYTDKDTGCIDVMMDPSNNKIIYAAMYQRRRRGWGFIGGGSGSGLYKSVDGGSTWKQLTNGLPDGDTGRIGIDIYPKDPNVVYTTYENKNGGVFRSEDKGESWVKMSDTNPRPMYYSTIRIDPNNDQRIWILGAQMFTSVDGGQTFVTDVVSRIHGDHQALWIDPANSDHMIIGSDGGIYFSYDRGLTWDFINTLPLAQFYEIGYDMREPYNVYGGLQDNGSWQGPSATKNRIGITNDDWFTVGGGDGFYTQVELTDQELLYLESQNGELMFFNLNTKESKFVYPEPGDGEESYRFNWNSPIVVSSHNSDIIYFGGNRLFRSGDKGINWTRSKDLTKQKNRKELPFMGMLPNENSLSLNDGTASYGNIITIAESPVTQGVLWIGTDDGNVQLTRDDGATWIDMTEKFPGLPDDTYVSRIAASYFDESHVYITFDGHRNNDFKPYVYVTDNFGRTWRSINSGLPEGGTVNVIREHHRNPDLLFIGTEREAYFSINRGISWIRFKNIPVVPVDDIAIHPRENDLIFGTHGRSIYILDDITSLELLTEDVLAREMYLFPVRDAERFQFYNGKANPGFKIFTGDNPEFGALITYYLNTHLDTDDEVLISIYYETSSVRTLKGSKVKGFNRIAWDLRSESLDDDGRSRAPFILPGDYTIELSVKGMKETAAVRVKLDPRISVTMTDLRAQRSAALRIHRMEVLSSSAERKIHDLQKQVTEISESEKSLQVPGSVSDQIRSLSDNLQNLNTQLRGEGQRISERSILRLIGNLEENINGYTAAPTSRRLEQIGSLEMKLDSILDNLNRIITVEIPAVNRKLNEYGAPFLDPGSIIELSGR